MGVDYNRSKVPRLLSHDSSHKDGTLRCACTLDTTGDIYASNNDTRLSTGRWARLASCNRRIHVGSVNEHIDITRGEALETTRVLFVGPTTDDVFSRNVDDVPNRVAPFYRVEAWPGWVG